MIHLLNLIGKFLCYFWIVFFAINIFFHLTGKKFRLTHEQDRVIGGVMILSAFIGFGILLATL